MTSIPLLPTSVQSVTWPLLNLTALLYNQNFGIEVLTDMKASIHPAYEEIRVMCACGNSFTTRSTHKGDLHVEICSNCHPFFTGKQKLVDTAGRVERFRRKYAKAEPAKK